MELRDLVVDELAVWARSGPMFEQPATEVKKRHRELRCRMAAGRDVARHAGTRYGKTFAAVLRPAQEVEAEVAHLHEVERAGECAETPLIAFLGLILFLLPIFLFMLSVAFLAYYIAR
jgi:hypothetical protein